MFDRVLFLDVDGVLNSTDWFRRRPKRTALTDNMSVAEIERVRADHGFDPVCISRLNTLVRRAGCVVVISSTWRKINRENTSQHDPVKRMLAHRGFEHPDLVVSATPCFDRVVSPSGMMSAQPRGLEIQAWLDAFHTKSFVILDDEDDMAHLRHRLVQTSFDDGGLLDEHVDRAVAMLTEVASG